MTSTTPRTVSTFLTRPAALVVLMGGLLLSACGGTAPVVDPAPTPTPTPTPDPTPNPAPAFAPVKISFRPAATAALPGYTTNTGTAYDTAKSGTDGNAGWITEASVGTATPVPVLLTDNTRDRGTTNATAEQSTLIHMQYTATSIGNKTPGAFKYDLPNGKYTVTASVGDANDASASSLLDSTHVINVNGAALIAAYKPTNAKPFTTGTATVDVTTKTLVFDARNGKNTKLNYITITAVQ
jgi:hypothetical protein